MTNLVMADSISAASLVGLNVDAFAGYANGSWPDFPLIAGEHPGKPILDITVTLADVGNTFDIETGDGSPGQAPVYVVRRTFAGIWRPVLYCPQSSVGAVVAACESMNLPRASYRLWAAHYGHGDHLCGPATCGCPWPVDGTQWVDHGPWDESTLVPSFFTMTPPPAPPVAPPNAQGVDTMVCDVPGGGILTARPDGAVDAFGCEFLGSMFGHPLNAPIVGICATESGKGYWLVGADGGIFCFGDAPYYGPTAQFLEAWNLGQGRAIPIIGIARGSTPGVSYVIVGDGGGPAASLYEITDNGQFGDPTAAVAA